MRDQHDQFAQVTLRQVVGGDFTLEMMRVGRRRNQGQQVDWSATDALNLPFPDALFDAITSGYLMRNVGDLDRAWAEEQVTFGPDKVDCPKAALLTRLKEGAA